MRRRLKVLYLPHPPQLRFPWMADLEKALNSQHEFRMHDEGAPLKPQIEDVDVVVDHGGGHSTREMADAAISVKLWQILGTGFESFDIPYWRSKGIPVANTPGPFSAPALAECALMFMLMLAHRWHEGEADLQRHFLYGTMGEELEDRLLLLFGFGASARALASRALGCRMRIAAIEIRDVPEADRREFKLESVGKPEDLERLLPTCDYLSLHLHLNPETRHVINAERLKLMKPSAYLINVARGALVDEQALYQSLAEGRLAGAGLDVFGTEPPDLENPLFKLPNVVVTPHIAGATDGTSRRRAACVAENVDRIAQGLEPKYRVDQP